MLLMLFIDVIDADADAIDADAIDVDVNHGDAVKHENSRWRSRGQRLLELQG